MDSKMEYFIYFPASYNQIFWKISQT